MTDQRPDLDPIEDAVGPISDDDVAALADNLRSDAGESDARVEVTEASEHVGTGTDR